MQGGKKARPLTFQEKLQKSDWFRNGTREHFAVHHEVQVPETIAGGTRIADVLLAIDSERFPSMTSARKAVRAGLIIVNGIECNTTTVVGGGDKIAIQSRTSFWKPEGRCPVKGVNVLFEDDELAVVFKPAGLLTYPPEQWKEYGLDHRTTMAGAVLYVVSPPAVRTKDDFFKPRLVHRLDKLTSGLMLCAKTARSERVLGKAFEERKIHKQYRAIVSGQVEGEEGEIDSPIFYDDKNHSAQTTWRVLSRARSVQLGNGHITELALFPRTGRTHQLRRHCADVLKTPIIGDDVYGGPDVDSGMYLSAIGLSFLHPDRAAGEEGMDFLIDAPEKFKKLLLREQFKWDSHEQHRKTREEKKRRSPYFVT